jgi:O-antigen/teichoic acid export membrane protein
VTAFILVFQELGMGTAIIQDTGVTRQQLSSIFWVNVGIALVLSLLIVAVAPLAAMWYEENAVTNIMRVLAVGPLLSAFGMVSNALLVRRMQFRRLAMVRTGAAAVSSAAGVAVAAAGCGAWALIVRQLASGFLLFVLLAAAAKWRPDFTLSLRSIRRHISFGMAVKMSALFTYFARNADDLLVGAMLGAPVLGIYQMAYRLMLWPLDKVTRVVGGVMLPAFSGIKDDKERVRSVFLRATSCVAMITFPLVLGMAVVAPIIPQVLGEKWHDVVPIFRILCVLGMAQSVTSATGTILVSQGKPNIALRLQAVFATVVTASFVIGLRWGAEGVALCYVTACMLLAPVQIMVSGRLIGMGFFAIIRAIGGVFACAVTMAAAAVGAGYLVPEESVWARLAAQVCVGVVVYIVCIRVFRLRAYSDLVTVIKEHFDMKTRAADG